MKLKNFFKLSDRKIFKNFSNKSWGLFWRSAKVKRIGLICLGILGLVVLSIIVFNFIYQDKILPKTYLGGQNFGGLTREAAKNKLTDLIEVNKESKLFYVQGEKNFEIKIGDLKVDYNNSANKTLDSLLAVGKKGSPGKMIKEQFFSIFSANSAEASYSLDDGRLNEYLNDIGKQVNQKEKDATIAFNNTEPYVVPEVTGQNFPLGVNYQISKDSIANFKFSDNQPFVIIKVYPKITAKMAEGALAKTRELLNRDLTLKARDKTYEIKPENIPDLLEFGNANDPSSSASPEVKASSADSLVPQFSADKVGKYLDTIAKEVNQDAKDAQFKVDGGKVVTFAAAETGYSLQKEEAIKMVISALNNNQDSIILPVKQIDPVVASSDPAQAGIVELVGEGKTSWRGSPKNRIFNLSLGANKISGTIVKPGEEFSTIKTIGEIGPSTGFLQELVIKNGNQVVPDYGGGLCQVSTTLFRAVLNSGLKITARTNHSFRVSYYEPPVGMDATIYDPAPDFKFINDMKTPILIWASAGTNTLSFQIYGTKDGRQISISNPTISNYTSPPNPVYTFSNTMAPGAIRQVEKALQGCTASFHYNVKAADGTVLENQTFTSKYIALANSYLYGPGAAVPGVQGAATAAPTPGPSPTPAPTEPTPAPTQ